MIPDEQDVAGPDQASLPLRERQALAVQADLRKAFIHLVAREGLNGFTLKQVAQSAGVSERTLYRHYASRDALVDAVREHDEAQLEARVRASLEGGDIWSDTELMARTFATFADYAELVRASRILRLESATPSPTSRRTQETRDDLVAAGVHPDAVEQLAALVRLLDGSDTWVRLNEEDLHVDATAAGDAVQWAMQVLIRAALQESGPLEPRIVDVP